MFDVYPFESVEELKRKRKVYKLITKRWLYQIGKFYVQKLRLPLPPVYPITLIYKHFIGGKTIEESIEKIKQLKNIKAIIDYAVEGIDDEQVFENNLRTYLHVIDTISVEKSKIPFIAVKPTALASEKWLRVFSEEGITIAGIDVYKSIKNRFFTLFDAAYQKGIIVLVDAEKSYTQQAVDSIVWEAMLTYNKDFPYVWNTVQLYRKDRLEFMENEIISATLKGIQLGYKLVRGAYHEQELAEALKEKRESPVFEKKEETDR